MPFKTKVELFVHLGKFTPEFRVDFMISRVDIFNCLLEIDLLSTKDCVLHDKEKNMFCGKVNRSLELQIEPTPETANYLTVQATQPIPARTEIHVKLEVRKEDCSQVLSFQGIVFSS